MGVQPRAGSYGGEAGGGGGCFGPSATVTVLDGATDELLGQFEAALMDMLDEAAVSFQGVLTKIDKVSSPMTEVAFQRVSGEFAGHVAAHPSLAATSARTGHGIEGLRAELASLARPATLG